MSPPWLWRIHFVLSPPCAMYNGEEPHQLISCREDEAKVPSCTNIIQDVAVHVVRDCQELASVWSCPRPWWGCSFFALFQYCNFQSLALLSFKKEFLVVESFGLMYQQRPRMIVLRNQYYRVWWYLNNLVAFWNSIFRFCRSTTPPQHMPSFSGRNRMKVEPIDHHHHKNTPTVQQKHWRWFDTGGTIGPSLRNGPWRWPLRCLYHAATIVVIDGL